MIELLNKLNKKNNIKFYSIYDEKFKTYGRVINNNFFELIEYMENNTKIPDVGNVYIPSIEELEKMNSAKIIKNELFGEMEIQIGYCNGKNSTFNGVEYHKGSEINIAVTDFVLILGHTWNIKNNQYDVKDSEMFYLKKGDAVEMYQTTLHLSPCKINDEGFKDIVILPKGTNTPLTNKIKITTPDNENCLLLQKNKWVISHKEREPLIKQGAFPGIIGENIEILYK